MPVCSRLCVAVRSAWEWCYLSAQVSYRPSVWLALALTAGTVGMSAVASGSGLIVYLLSRQRSFLPRRCAEAPSAMLPTPFWVSARWYMPGCWAAPLLRPGARWTERSVCTGRRVVYVHLVDGCVGLLQRPAVGAEKLAHTIAQKTVVGFFGGLVGALLPLLLSPWIEVLKLAGQLAYLVWLAWEAGGRSG